MRKGVKADVKANLQILEEHIDSIIEELVLKHDYAVDLEEDFDDLIRKIYKSLVKIWFKGRDPKPKEFESKIRAAKEKRGIWFENVLSYYIAKYVSDKARREEEIVRRRVRWEE